ncbi:MAG TPA: hypothetical protein PK629_01095 [Oscillospiraceae bacterium]|nr:hypothetical protein [Oscillospiraceae bacterium]HPF56418.1 hypothetical protein [Clostridiales bacterium]HPK35626.1 hypothetical protein [Oscillospiraceae bacterium]HPR74689.1 hypothetical protein [Oscillospiraceae bacterium]
MAKSHVKAGICGFETDITATTNDDDLIELEVKSNCPMVMAGAKELGPMDPLTELFKKPCETEIYKVVSPHLKHTACPVCTAMLKTMEVEAGLALPKDVEIKIER